MEPLREFRILVLADAKGRGCAVDRMDDDVAAIEGGVDVFYAHGTRIVSPDTPGKSLNMASANFDAAMPGCAAGEPALAA